MATAAEGALALSPANAGIESAAIRRRAEVKRRIIGLPDLRSAAGWPLRAFPLPAAAAPAADRAPALPSGLQFQRRAWRARRRQRGQSPTQRRTRRLNCRSFAR